MNVRGTIEQGIRRWWDGGGGGMGSALRSLSAPLEWAYRESSERRNRLFDRTGGTRVSGLAVVSVGNLAAGGTGKTPLAAWTARTLASSGVRVTQAKSPSSEVTSSETRNQTLPLWRLTPATVTTGVFLPGSWASVVEAKAGAALPRAFHHAASEPCGSVSISATGP